MFKKKDGMRFTYCLALPVLLALAACSEADIISPGEVGQIDDGGDNGGGGGDGGDGGNPPSGGTCVDGTTETDAVGGVTTCAISGVITEDLELPGDVYYQLDGRVDVGIDVGGDGNAPDGAPAVLTISAGATFFGASGSDFIVVNRGSQIVANGSVTDPVVFTAQQDLEGTVAETDRGLWGGMVILGRAPISSCDAFNAGDPQCENRVEGTDAFYGGNDEFDNSGVLNYVQVLFAGNAISQDNELNGITLAGVGSETEIDYVQVHNNLDDGIEWFGGTVNARHIVLTGIGDDSLDWSEGWSGNIQFALVAQATDDGDYGVEAGNSSLPAQYAQLQDNPSIANFTFIGSPNANSGMLLRGGMGGTHANGIVTGSSSCLDIDGQATIDADPVFHSMLLDCDTTFVDDSASGGETSAEVEAVFNSGGSNNVTDEPNSLNSGFFPGSVEQGMTAFDSTTLGNFFESADYVGAFSPDETPTENWAFGWTYGLFEEPECPEGTTSEGTINDQNRCGVSGVITGDLRLTRGNIYELQGRVDVGVDVGGGGTAPDGDSATLTIESGVTIFGESGSDFLVVNRGSQIFVNGTRDNPVIMTSLQDVNGTQTPEDRGQWGGFVILGRAPISSCDAFDAGDPQCENRVEGTDAFYGGDDPADDSGRLNYLQLKFAGNAISQDNELNGITLAGVGSETEIDYVQVHNNLDDGIEWFGGTVNARHIVLTGIGDDSLDWSEGWSGNIQFALVVQSDDDGDYSVEAGNSSLPAQYAQLQDNPSIANFTFIGSPNANTGMLLRGGMGGTHANGIVTGSSSCLDIDGQATIDADPVFHSVMLDCDTTFVDDSASGGETSAEVEAVFNSGGSNNVINQANTLTDTFVNGPTESGVTVFDVTTLGSFFTPVDYIGAVRDADDDWWSGWTCSLATGSDC